MSNPWVTLNELRDAWSDAPADDYLCNMYLDAAYDQCAAYAPVLADGVEIPRGYQVAVIAQTRSVYAAVKLASARDGNLTADGYSIPVFPLDWTIQQALRPKRPVGGVA